MAPILTVHLLRHGETLQAAEGYFAGDINPPLTDRGRLQAEDVAAAALALHLEALYVSPKLRAHATAEPIARACGLSPVVDERLREIGYGSWEGRKESDVQASDPEAYGAWTKDPAMHPPPGGETAFQIAARALPVVERAEREHPNGRVMFVTHKATIRVLVCALLDLPIARFRDRIACPAASLTTIEFGPRGPMLVRLGDVHHLRNPSPS
jgi:broad specificity phosphatase PhoE